MLNKTIYIITNEDKVILRAFTNKKTAMMVLEDKYKQIHDDCYIEPCALEYDENFIDVALKKYVKDLRSQIFQKIIKRADCEKILNELREILKI